MSRHMIGIALVFGAVAITALSPSQTVAQQKVKADVAQVAAALRDGNQAQAARLAGAAANDLEGIVDLMEVLRGRNLDGYTVAAAAEVALAKSWSKDQGAKTKKAWFEFATELRFAGLALAQAKGAAQVKANANVAAACNKCHKVFKD